MEAKPESHADEIKRLRRCINDLVSVLALPAMWTGGEPSHIVGTLLDTLLGMLRLEFVYARWKGTVGAGPVEMVRAAPAWRPAPQPREIGQLLSRALGDDPQRWPPAVRIPLGSESLSLVPMRLGSHGEIGLVVAASRRPSFPEQTERLVLNVAANQAYIGLRESHLLTEQKRVASELDQRVGQRTAELAAINEELRNEIAARKLKEEKLRLNEEALRDSEQSFRLIVDGIAGLVAIMTATGGVETVNRQVLEYFGKTTEELKRWSTTDDVHPDDLAGVISAWTHSIETGAPYDVDHRLRRADGVYRWFHSRGLPLLDDEGRVVRWYVLLTDIDGRKQAENELRRSEAFLTRGQSLSRTGTFSWRVAAGEINWSEQLYSIFEFEPGLPVTLERIGSRVHPDDIPLLNDMVERARNAVSDFEYDHRLMMPDRSIKYLHMVGHATRSQNGEVEYIGACQDVTQRRLSEDALAHAQSELARVTKITSLGALTASIAHEVNQPLSGIVTNAGTCLRMLATDPPNVDGARETARRTIRDANRATDVITRLRALFTHKGGATESVDLNEATREVVALSLNELQRNRVILRSELAGDLPSVPGDRVQLQQVILNLLRNATDAMNTVEDRPRLLLIKTERDGDNGVRLRVQDSGIGFDPQVADKLFEAFYSTKSDGMGVGLSVSRSIIENHQGRMWAARNDGPGATFSFSIPCGGKNVVEAGNASAV